MQEKAKGVEAEISKGTQTTVWENAKIKFLPEEEYADFLEESGVDVIRKKSAFYRQANDKPGILIATHWMGTLTPEQLEVFGPNLIIKARPTDLSERTNGSFDLHALSFAENETYADKLNGKKGSHARQRIKKAKTLENSGEIAIELLDNPEELEKQGYGVVVSALERTKYHIPPTEEAYRTGLQTTFYPGQRLVVAGFDTRKENQKQLLGYTTASGVETSAGERIGYVDSIIMSDPAYKAGIELGNGLVSQVTEINSGILSKIMDVFVANGVDIVVLGRLTPEDPALMQYKRTMRFEDTNVPTVISIRRGFQYVVNFAASKVPKIKDRLFGAQPLPADSE